MVSITLVGSKMAQEWYNLIPEGWTLTLSLSLGFSLHLRKPLCSICCPEILTFQFLTFFLSSLLKGSLIKPNPTNVKGILSRPVCGLKTSQFLATTKSKKIGPETRWWLLFLGKGICVFIFSHVFHLRHPIPRLVLIPVSYASLTPMGTSEFQHCAYSLENSLPQRHLVSHTTKQQHSFLIWGEMLSQHFRPQSTGSHWFTALKCSSRYIS